MKYSIIIVNYNGGTLLDECIDFVLKTEKNDFEIILVDNASHDNSHLKAKKKFPNIHLITNKKNLGFCEGNNVGIREAQGDYIIFLNPDTKVEPNWLEELSKACQKNGEGFYQPKILNADNKSLINSTGGGINLYGFAYLRGNGNKDEKTI